jgi:hypothetical protein
VCFSLLACAVAIATSACCIAAASADGPPALQTVLSDAAKRTGADARDVQIIRTERKEWPNSGLGCPRPGEMYAQIITPGWLIEVRSGDRVLEYHTDARDRFVLCSPESR